MQMGGEMSDLVLWITHGLFGADFFGSVSGGLVGDFWHNDRDVVIESVKILYFWLQELGDFCLGLVVVVVLSASKTVEKRHFVMFVPREVQKICDTPNYKDNGASRKNFVDVLIISDTHFC